MYACVVDQDGNKRLHQHFSTNNIPDFLAKIKPFLPDLVVGCECTFNGYWLADLERLADDDRTIRKLETFLTKSAKVHDANSFFRLQTIPGVGPIIAMTMLYEIHDIRRFPTVGDFLSYCRLVRGEHQSNGKKYGSPGKKIGNAYLKWAFSEAIPLLKRQDARAKAFCDRIEKKHGKARANSLLAVKLGRAVYFMLCRGEVFDLDRMIG
ncbi:Transposase IS116/IS110/IS902 family protein [Novipirellula aureliae]|uniref:Transposase IS116/IS110/IS902 family protein n=1 Tax=Novipirellula aureliae TaxID=2527966 RepID=A0A5C6DZE6_9BACT|nr:transposase [Novipirellula aureliae]TWU40269.1 Transposase IS116/IS110/IS902 family protein [Novipirellula aureliae]